MKYERCAPVGNESSRGIADGRLILNSPPLAVSVSIRFTRLVVHQLTITEIKLLFQINVNTEHLFVTFEVCIR